MENYIKPKDYEELYIKRGKPLCAGGSIKNCHHKKHCASGRPKQPQAQKASVLAVSISACQ
jgi:flavoprotein